MTRWYVIAVAVLAFSCRRSPPVSRSAADAEWKPWTKGETSTLVPGLHHPAFDISTWGSDDGYHLVGHFVYKARRYPDDPPVAALHGKQREDWFWPNATLQVSGDCRDSWQTIERSQHGQETLQLDGSKGGAGLTVSFEAFKPWLGKAECGRVVLESGETFSFSLSSLIPPPSKNPPAP